MSSTDAPGQLPSTGYEELGDKSYTGIQVQTHTVGKPLWPASHAHHSGMQTYGTSCLILQYCKTLSFSFPYMLSQIFYFPF